MSIIGQDGKCNARTKQGTLCTRSAGFGTGHLGTGACKYHFGATPQAELMGNLELARREYGVMGIPVDIRPHEAILEAVRIAAGEVAYCSARISDLADEDVEIVATTVKTRPLSMGKDGESEDTMVQERTVTNTAQLNVWIQARHAAMDRMVAYSATALKAGVQERAIKLAEQTGELIARVLRGFLTDMGLADDPRAPVVMRKHLALVGGTAVPDADAA